MAKKKEFVEGIDYVITIRKRKKFIKNPKKNICPICENCNHKNLCLNRRNSEKSNVQIHRIYGQDEWKIRKTTRK